MTTIRDGNLWEHQYFSMVVTPDGLCEIETESMRTPAIFDVDPLGDFIQALTQAKAAAELMIVERAE